MDTSGPPSTSPSRAVVSKGLIGRATLHTLQRDPEPVRRTIYIQLMGEDVDAWRPVEAEEERDGVFRLPDRAPEGEVWEFEPNSLVACEYHSGDLVAVQAVQG